MMVLDHFGNTFCSLIFLSIIGLILLREFVKRWRLTLRMASGDESLLKDGSITVKTITDAPPGSNFVDNVPAVEIKE
tara:strand:+ start:4719 stop:4949 length:231 start_codon:yes stop_codon:yes gene_type:complete